MESITLFNGHKMPKFGLGTWRIDRKVIEDIVYKALKMGYRHIDCAAVYKNEDLVGNVFNKIFKEEQSLKREDVFVTSKLWNQHHGHVEEACRQTLKDLQLEYLDLYLIHWPYCFEYGGSINMRDVDPVEKGDDGRAKLGKISMSDTWKEMEKLVDKGLVRSIGISNFRHPMIMDLCKGFRIQPAVHQYESHPLFQRPFLAAECKKMNIGITAYSPLGSQEGREKCFQCDAIQKLSEKYKKTKAQIILRWAIERGHIVIVKSSSEERLKENMAIFDFKLTEEDMKMFLELDEGKSVLIDMLLQFWGFDPYC